MYSGSFQINQRCLDTHEQFTDNLKFGKPRLFNTISRSLPHDITNENEMTDDLNIVV